MRASRGTKRDAPAAREVGRREEGRLVGDLEVAMGNGAAHEEEVGEREKNQGNALHACLDR
jgi:hypothetical protein